MSLRSLMFIIQTHTAVPGEERYWEDRNPQLLRWTTVPSEQVERYDHIDYGMWLQNYKLVQI